MNMHAPRHLTQKRCLTAYNVCTLQTGGYDHSTTSTSNLQNKMGLVF